MDPQVSGFVETNAYFFASLTLNSSLGLVAGFSLEARLLDSGSQTRGGGTGTWGTHKVRRRETDTRLAKEKRTENKLRTSVCYRDADFWVSTSGRVGRRPNSYFDRVLVVARRAS